MIICLTNKCNLFFMRVHALVFKCVYFTLRVFKVQLEIFKYNFSKCLCVISAPCLPEAVRVGVAEPARSPLVATCGILAMNIDGNVVKYFIITSVPIFSQRSSSRIPTDVRY